MIHYIDRKKEALYRAQIEVALDALPPRLRAIASGIDVVCGTSAWSSRVYNTAFLPDGRKLDDYAHTIITIHHKKRTITAMVFLPKPESANVVIHEFGHAIQWAGDRGRSPEAIVPVTEYAKTTPLEAYAEAFTAWIGFGHGHRKIADVDPETAAHFARLASTA